MIFVDPRSPKPLYEQIKDSVRQQILLGVIQQDEQLPSVRQLAAQAAINPNTIQRAYRELESEGLLYSVVGRGCFVAPLALQAKQKRKLELVKKIKPLYAELQRLEVSDEELLELLKGGGKNDD